MKDAIEKVLRNRILYIGSEIPEVFTKDKRDMQLYDGYPAQMIEEIYQAVLKLEQNKRKTYNRLRVEIRHSEGRCKDCGKKLDTKSIWRCKVCIVKANYYVKKSRLKKSMSHNGGSTS